MIRGNLETHPFSEQLLLGWLGKSHGVFYVVDYLKELRATAVLHEHHYVDRHFIDDFATYYARSFNAPAPYCRRLHFFDGLSEKDINDKLDQAYCSIEARKRVEAELAERYLGFVVWRPLDGAVLGRTVLRTYDSDNNRRHYEVVRDYRVNVAGIRLTVRGLAYQQQDRGAAVCASTALWSALQQVAHLDGHRTPTPSAVTRAAGSPFPASHGLSDSQMAVALSTLGYVADLFVPVAGRALFRAQVVSCLLSHLPVVLLLGSDRASDGHAVTVTGFSDPPSIVDVTVSASLPPLRMRSGSMDVVYVHDDNLGSHAHYELLDQDRVRPDGSIEERLILRRGRTNRPSPPWWKIDELPITAALVPKPGKLRLPISSLFMSLLVLRRVFDVVLQGMPLHFEARFDTGISYRDSLFERTLAGEQLRNFHACLSLPRHVGIISVHHDDAHILEVVLDVSEVTRHRSRPPVLALVCPGIPSHSRGHAKLVALKKYFDCLLITGPA